MTQNTTGTVHLIPVGLSDAPTSAWLPEETRQCARHVSVYIAENAKSARAFLKLIEAVRPLQEITIHTLTEKTTAGEIRNWLGSVRQGLDIGVVSEAGCPAVADPGARVVAQAHTMGLTVKPWVGPSSILLSLMASGLDGQRFTFHGYAPVNPAERAKQLRAWEQASLKGQQTQILIETPYRNEAMFETLLQSLKGTTRLCVARSLTAPEEWIQTHDIAHWKKQPKPDLNRKPAVFLFLAQG